MKKLPTAGIILAAGESRRFGEPKQLAKLNDKCLLEWVIDAALASDLETVVLILGYDHQKILQHLTEKKRLDGIQVTINSRYDRGQSQSVILGVSEIADTFDAAMFLLGDQPLVDAATINHLLDCFYNSGKNICVPVHRGRRGNPTLFSKHFFKQLTAIEGDMGGREIIDSHPDHVLEVEIENPLVFFDIDTPEDLEDVESLGVEEKG
jgi:molybdenum cofactor cytidylyltransferase